MGLRTNRCGIFVLLSFLGSGIVSADWLQFRGNDGLSKTDTSLPLEFGGDSQKNIAWKTELPGRAVNAPIVVGNQVIATASSGHGQKRLHVFSLDDETGNIRWQRRFWATGRTLCHPLSAVAAPTPSSDGDRIFALFASNDLVCLDLAGNLIWMRSLSTDWPSAFDDRGLASSTWISNGTLVVQIACSGDSFVFGLNAKTGATDWKIPLAKDTNWATPCDVTLDGKKLVMLQSADKLLIIEPKTGEIRHTYEAEGNYIPSPTIANETILVPADGLTAIRFEPGKEEAEVLWQEAKVGAEGASPVATDEMCYVIRNPNVLTAAKIEDASIAWKKRLKGNGFWATPLLSKDHIYVANTDGVVQVVELESGELVAENDLGEEILGSPATSGSAIYLRGTSSMFKIKSI